MFSIRSAKMWRYILLLTALSATFVSSNDFGPKYPSTKGDVWPKPRSQATTSIYFDIHPHQFNITVSGETCSILTKAVDRYLFITRDFHRLTRRIGSDVPYHKRSSDTNYRGPISTLNVNLSAPCEEYPYFGMDESYNLTVNSQAELKSSSIWGVLRGLETWTHLLYMQDDEIGLRINKTDIVDAPRYPHRGLLIDTSRHYISIYNIRKTLNAMAINKMNVLHWHIVDDQSFPYQSETFPELSRQGAYHRKLVYTKENITSIINYARDRGIRVLPEFDVPGHTNSWGRAYPDILVPCYKFGRISDAGPMDPTKNATYDLLQDLYLEIQNLFPDRYLHIGGDEVNLDCWKSNPDLQRYMRDHSMTSVRQLHALFMQTVIPLLKGRSPIVWQEVYDDGVQLSKDTLIQVWKGDGISEMESVLSDGYKLVYSSAWYLDHLKSGGDWEKMYQVDPRKLVSQRGHKGRLILENIVGGEACMWGEVADDTNVISRVWPRASAVAEKLWSPETNSSIPASVYNRIEEHTCRMNRRGVPAQPPSGPGFCVGALL